MSQGEKRIAPLPSLQSHDRSFRNPCGIEVVAFIPLIYYDNGVVLMYKEWVSARAYLEWLPRLVRCLGLSIQGFRARGGGTQRSGDIWSSNTVCTLGESSMMVGRRCW